VGGFPLKKFVHLGRPLTQHLHAAFPQIADAKLDDLADLFRGGVFGHGDQRYLARIALRLGAGVGDALTHVIQPVG
jgi:hypothetical protein